MALSAALIVATVPGQVTARPARDDIVVWINGVSAKESDDSVRPYINRGGRTMVSVRSVADSLSGHGCSVDWKQDSLSVSMSCDGKDVSFYFQLQNDGSAVGMPIGWVNGMGFHLHTAPEMNRGRAFLGLRDIGELLDIRVEYIPKNPEEGFHTPVAAMWFGQLDLVDRQEYAEAVNYLDRYTLATVKDYGTVNYDLDVPENAIVFPVSIRPQHVAQYIRALAESNETQRVYAAYAYADPDHQVELASQPIAVAADGATAQTLLAQRHLLARQFTAQFGSGVRVAASIVPAGLRRYRDREGTLIEVFPTGEMHYLTRRKALNLSSKFKFGATVGGVGTFLASPLNKAWPVGTFAMALIALSGATYSGWMAIRLDSYCLADNSPGATVKYFYVRVPRAIAGPMDSLMRDRFGLSTQIGSILYTMPHDCDPWSGIEPLPERG